MLTVVFRSEKEVKFVNNFEVAPTKEKEQKNPTKNWMIYKTAPTKTEWGKRPKYTVRYPRMTQLLLKTWGFWVKNNRIKGSRDFGILSDKKHVDVGHKEDNCISI